MKELNFDPQRYSYLLRLRERYSTHLAALSSSASSGAPLIHPST